MGYGQREGKCGLDGAQGKMSCVCVENRLCKNFRCLKTGGCFSRPTWPFFLAPPPPDLKARPYFLSPPSLHTQKGTNPKSKRKKENKN